MPLSALLYRCPLCGQDPLDEHGSAVVCRACAARFRRSRGGTIEITEPSGSARYVAAVDLARAIDRLGGPLTAAELGGGRIGYSARAEASRGLGMESIEGAGGVLGFVESWSQPTPGTLAVTERTLCFEPAREGAEWNEGAEIPLLALRAIQTSSSTLQLATRRDLYQFRFEQDSPRRWEALLRELVRREYRREGRGEVVEFQPRIVTS